MLTITRTWNAVAASWLMRRGIALARDYARRRHAFGDYLINKPLHVDTLASIAAEQEAATLMAFRCAELIGKGEHHTASEVEKLTLRLLTPIAKLLTAKQAVTVLSETIESFGGAGYVEDTGLPRLLADAQVLPIWEGTTNVLSLDTLRAMGSGGTFEAFTEDLHAHLAAAKSSQLRPCVDAARAAMEHATQWLAKAMSDRAAVEAGARRFALTIGRAYQLALLVAHAQWAFDHSGSKRAIAAARRFTSHGVDRIVELDPDDAALLA
ncbi:MAG: acyl-CoA dehydrogenase, partial [Deltaproteobacteria bacterium]|nr:acyl-CoA dehydrogenase [Deltaproteobacteria bacterium]